MKPVVLIEHHRLRYTRYEGRQSTDIFVSAAPLTEHWVEVLRSDPAQFKEIQREGPEAA
jgi:hypothetical protein